MSKKYSAYKHKNKLNIFKVLFFIIILCAIFGVVYYGVNNLLNSSKNNLGNSVFGNSISKDEPIPEDSVANIVAIGDTLCHSQNFKDAYDSSTGTYDFSPMFKYVTKYFTNKTVAVGNCEASFAGPSRGYSGYPTFNTPEHLAIDLKELGLGVMTTANNHSLDMGFSGLTSTLNYLDDAGLDHTGSARNADEQSKILFKDLNGIKTAFLAFTYGTNGIPVPSGKEFCVNLIDKDFIKSKLNQAKSEGAEAICVSMHWGVEYKIVETAEQDDLANFLISNGANIVLGCHPHVLEPMEMKTVTLDDGTTKTGFVIYSMGNFFSAQTFPNTRDTVILNVQMRKNGQTGEITIDNAKYAPIYVYDNGTSAKDRYELLDLASIVSEYESDTGNWSLSLYNLAKTEIERINKIVGPEIDNTLKNNSNTDKNNNISE